MNLWKRKIALRGPLAQLARALPWHGRGHGFESHRVHQESPVIWRVFLFFGITEILYGTPFSPYGVRPMRLLIIGKKESYAARRLKEEGDRAGRQVAVVSVSDLRFDVTEGRRSVFVGETDILSRFDAVFPLCFGPYYSETLMLMEWAATRGVRVIEASLAAGKYVSSKTYDIWKLAEKGLPVPASMQCMGIRDAGRAFETLGSPLIVKGVHGARGRWVFKVRTQEELRKHLDADQSGIFVFQEHVDIEDEYRVMTVGGRAVGAVRRAPIQGEFRRNFSLGAALESVPLTSQLSILAETASRVLGYALAGVDIAISRGKPYILEVNRRPGFRGFEAATGMNIAKAFIDYVAQDRDCWSAECGKVHALHGHHQKAG